MLKLIRFAVALIALASACAAADPPIWALTEVYSNASGSVQFVVHATGDSGQQFLQGYSLVAYDRHGQIVNTYAFPNDLPRDSRRRSFLVATQGFADLHVLEPDYIVPNGFFSIAGGAVSVAGHTYWYLALPTDGVQAYWQDPDTFWWYLVAVATNFAGQRYSFGAEGTPVPPAIVPPATPPPQPPSPPQVSAPTAVAPVVEFHHAAWDHYFITMNAVEIEKLDNGSIGGWMRTGLQFNAYVAPGPGTSPVCRFLSTTFSPKSSHFYTPFPVECSQVQANRDWLLESAAAFNVVVPVGGACPSGLIPVRRAYNDGRGGAPNHRYTSDLATWTQMLASGWVPEGLGEAAIEMCVPP